MPTITPCNSFTECQQNVSSSKGPPCILTLSFSSFPKATTAAARRRKPTCLSPSLPPSLQSPCACDDRSAKARSNGSLSPSPSSFESYSVPQKVFTPKYIAVPPLKSAAFPPIRTNHPAGPPTLWKSTEKAALPLCSGLLSPPISSRMDCGIDSSIAGAASASAAAGRMTRGTVGH